MLLRNAVAIWMTIIVLLVGIGSLVTLGLEPVSSSGPTVGEAQAPVLPTSSLAELMAQAAPTLEPGATATPTATPIPTLPPLVLPEVPVPVGGQVFMLTPVAPGAVG